MRFRGPERFVSFISHGNGHNPQPSPQPPLPDEILKSTISVTPEARELMERRANQSGFGIHPEAAFLTSRGGSARFEEVVKGTGKPERALLGEVTALTGVFTLTQPHGEVSLPPPPTNGHTQRP